MKNSKTLLMALALGASACLSIAQETGNPPPPSPDQRAPRHRGPQGPGARPPGPAIIAALDVNRDGILDAAELANAPAALTTLDKDGDGKLSAEEFRPVPPQHAPAPPARLGASEHPQPDHSTDGNPPGRPPGHHPAARHADGAGTPPPEPPFMAALDANHDGVIDASETANATAALKALDKNGDGQLTPDEYRPRRQGPRGDQPPREPAPPSEN